MNFLAHIFLSQNIDDLIVGNILEDYLVGRIDHPRHDSISKNFKMGVQLHRIIDTFTDSHQEIKYCKSLISPKYGKYSGILIDIYFDYFLVKNWDKYTSESLDFCCEIAYCAFEKKYELLPNKMQLWVNALLKYKWLNQYGTYEGIQRALNNMANIAGGKTKMEEGIVELKAFESELNASFIRFFPLLKLECDIFIKSQGFELVN